MPLGKKEAFVTALVVVAGLALGSAIDRRLPSADDIIERPFVEDVQVGQTADIRTASVTVRSVQAAEQVISYGSALDTVGIWLLAEIEITAADRPVVLTGMQLVSEGGLTYGGSGDAMSGCETAQPGIPMLCQVAFEVSPESLTGLKLQIPAGGEPGAPGDALALVDLGITDGARLVASAEPSVQMVRTTYGGAE